MSKHNLIVLMTIVTAAVLVATRSAFGVIVAGDNPSGPTTVTTYNGDGSGFSVVETVSYDGAAGAWQKQLINNSAPGTQMIFSGQQVPIHEQLTNAGPRGWTDWHEEILPVPQDGPFPDFLFTAGSLQVDRNGAPLIEGIDYTVTPTINNTGIGVTPGGDWVALSIFFSPSAAIQPGDTLGITKNIFEVFGDSDIWDVGEFALLAQFPTVPEPSTIALAAFGFVGFVAWVWRQKRLQTRTSPLIVILATSFVVLLAFRATHAAPLSYSGGVVSENFNFPNLAKEPDGLSAAFPTAGLPGWASDESSYIVMDGTTTTGALYSFGTSSADDRALGSIASSATGVVFYGLELRNDSLVSFSGLNLTYTGEQWRQTTAVQNVLNFQFSLTASSVSSSLGYTGVGALDFAAPHFGTATGGIDGNAAANRTTLSSLVSFGSATWSPGKTLFIRWRDPDDTGFDQGLAIDDLRFNAVPEPSSLALVAFGFIGLATWGWRRKR